MVGTHLVGDNSDADTDLVEIPRLVGRTQTMNEVVTHRRCGVSELARQARRRRNVLTWILWGKCILAAAAITLAVIIALGYGQ
jgi:hypothetical protein